MALTVHSAFGSFLRSEIPSYDTELAAAAGSRRGIDRCLRREFGLERPVFRSGSHRKGTTVGGQSDLDFFAVLPQAEARGILPASFMAKVRKCLAKRYSSTRIRASGPAVVLRFGQGNRSADVVPAVVSTVRGSIPIYRIVASTVAQTWLHTNPEVHAEHFRAADEYSGGTLKPLTRILKAWKYFRSVPISSFYLEMLATTLVPREGFTCAQGVREVLQILSTRDLRSLRDPAGISGLLHPCTSEKKRDTAQAKVDYALDHAQRAVRAERNGNHEEAIRQWRIVFTKRFPRYG